MVFPRMMADVRGINESTTPSKESPSVLYTLVMTTNLRVGSNQRSTWKPSALKLDRGTKNRTIVAPLDYCAVSSRGKRARLS